ncbi:GTP cyclohydrolase [Chelatococcus daeguensis]|uniref:GTP cyclohydrolase-2 n=1 Tax=Chelatococcus daeguensis TaxID=444444 RepID=A0AAC9JTS3_9HYPH|nr:GTP cyclohydrolase II RibA [Chelatococcus daeguensis]APF38199.1 GTP cyclohydrolase [Chelatococcus daeguensis]
MSSDFIKDRGQISVERALAEFRAGRPVRITGRGVSVLAVGIEGLDEELAAALERKAADRARLVLPTARLRRLGAERASAGIIALPEIDLRRVMHLSLASDARLDAPVGCLQPLDEAALELARLSLVLPAVVTVSVSPQDPALADVVAVSEDDIAAFRLSQVRSLRIVGRAPVPLEGASETEFVVFRGGEGLRDQVAIVVGRPDLVQTVPVRLHSACLTGDLFGSLKCDCGDQLRNTVQWMAENGGGILLYLDQEGRGNGIANKMRAYKLQAQGFDTYDADEILGFGLDQRRFDFAAEMLRQLGVASVSIMTNNPEKIAALKAAGLAVVDEQRVIGRPTSENIRYLAAKRERAGHFIDIDALSAHLPPRD